MKRICIISPDAYPLLVSAGKEKPVGGAETQLVTLGLKFSKKNYAVTFLVDDFGQKNTIKLNDLLTITKSPLRYMGGNNAHVIPDWVKLLINLIIIRADAHLLKLPNHLLFPIGLFCKLFRKKLFFICQIDRDVELTELQNNKFEYWLYKLGLKMTDGVITQNKTQLYGIKKIYSGHCVLIRNILSFKTSGKFAKEDHILWVGSNLPRKQPELFIELAKSLPDYKFKMIVSKSKQYPNVDNLKNVCAELDNLEFVGGVPFHEIHHYFEKASLLVSTSKSEGFPNIFLQAWQCSTPVVSLNINPDNIITKFNLGIVANSQDRMSDVIKELMDNEKLRKETGNECLKYIKKFHDTDEIVNKYCQLFDTIASVGK